MSIDINVYLRSKGGRTTRAQAKLSAKETHKNKKGSTSASASKKEVNHMGALATFMSSGNMLKSSIMKVPILRTAMLAGKTAEKGVNFLTSVYQAQTGENMIANNTRAYSKIISTLGIGYVEGAIDNWLYKKPTVQRQNYMLDYGRKLYTRNIENEKNQFS
jgi:hypothetical protein